mmetsp:Transcript_4159/g.6616  ORF Transcript_4159/g.6616 Transcript_4159/m.6616 type:complete len:114 (-) Transcript_4159:48-389(-)
MFATRHEYKENLALKKYIPSIAASIGKLIAVAPRLHKQAMVVGRNTCSQQKNDWNVHTSSESSSRSDDNKDADELNIVEQIKSLYDQITAENTVLLEHKLMGKQSHIIIKHAK